MDLCIKKLAALKTKQKRHTTYYVTEQDLCLTHVQSFCCFVVLSTDPAMFCFRTSKAVTM